MPFLGIGLHVIIALFFAIHVVRTGREMYWLFILFMFPLLGSIVYFVAIYLPDSRLDRGVRKTAKIAAEALDPGRALREAQQAFDLAPTAQNQMRLANLLLESGDSAQAVQHYEACLQGPFASDGEVRLGAARARLADGRAAGAADLLELLKKDHPAYRPEQVALLLGQAYAQAGRHADAGAVLAAAVERFASIEARAEYAIWAIGQGETAIANDQYSQIKAAMKHWNNHARTLNKPLVQRLEKAFAAAHP